MSKELGNCTARRAWAAALMLCLAVMPLAVVADPPADPPPGTVLPRVFCFRVTDIRVDETDPENDRFTFEFEILNWSDLDAGGLEMSMAVPTPGDIVFVGADVDVDGRPLVPEDVNGDTVIDAADLEDANGNGVLDAGEDINGNGRLDNDPIPGNLAFPNDWSVASQTASKVVWAAPEIFPGLLDGLPFINMIGAAAIGGSKEVEDFSYQCIPGFPATTSIDAAGNVDPAEAVDDDDNVLDGFTFTVDDLDAGEEFDLNWFITGAGEEPFAASGIGGGVCRISNRRGLGIGDSIGDSFEGNDFGFGLITVARVDSVGSPAPTFEGNTGVATSPLQFFDSVFNVPLPSAFAGPGGVSAGMAVEFGAGLTSEFVNPADNTVGAGTNAILLDQCADTPFPVCDGVCPANEDCAADPTGFCRCEPLFADIASFSANYEAGSVRLSWTTTSEIDNMGFRIWRSRGAREPVLITSVIPAQGTDLSGASYEFVDRAPKRRGSTYRYFLEDVDIYGEIKRHSDIVEVNVPRSIRRGARKDRLGQKSARGAAQAQ